MTRCHTGEIIYPAICDELSYMYITVFEDPYKHLCKPHRAPFKFIQICCYHLLHASRDRRTVSFLLFDLREDGTYTYIRGGRANVYNLLGNWC